MKKTFYLLHYVFLGGFAVLNSGCASYVETIQLDPATFSAVGKPVGGVVYYEPALIQVSHTFTQLIDKDKNLLGSAPLGCKEVVQKEEIITVADYQKPRVILHKPSWFATSEFSVTLNNGLLVGLTNKSTPQSPQILEQIVAGYAVAAAPVAAMVAIPACNGGPVIKAPRRFTY
ncbi:hypothetical protein [Variovorax sp. PvP013]|uniref:hypothetical protein n=1 Tax=Variovorax sp. PvP013 TaxID=3156435 RepID=UPI003D1B68D4